MANNKNSFNKVAFWSIVIVAIVYITTMILTHFHVNPWNIIYILKCVASILMVLSTSVLAWRYVRNKDIVWKCLYFISLAIVIFGVILPLLPIKF